MQAAQKRKRKIPLLFYNYLATEMLAPLFAAFIVINGVFFLVRLIPFLNTVLELHIGFADFIRLFSYLLPNMFLYSIPIVSMLGIIIGFSRLANDTEILAFKASGIGILHTVPPVVVIAIFVSLLTGFFSVKLLPTCNISMRQMMHQLAKEKIDKGIKERVFTEALGDLVIHINEIDRETGIWHEVWVSDMRDREIPAITMARYGQMRNDLDQMIVTLTLKDGSLHIPEGNNSQTIRFNQYVITIPLYPAGKDPRSKTRRTMTMSELKEDAIKNAENALGRDRLTEYHKRLVLPVGCFILSLIGLPLGLQAGPGKRAIGIPLGLALYIIYYICFTMARDFSISQSDINIAATMWTPNIIFFIIALILLRRVADEKQLLPDTINTMLDQGIEFMKNMSKRCFSLFSSPAQKTKANQRKEEGIVTTSRKPEKLRGNVRSRVFHFYECEHYYCKNCSIEFKNVAIAIQSGFEPCRFCRELMEKKAGNQHKQPDDQNIRGANHETSRT